MKEMEREIVSGYKMSCHTLDAVLARTTQNFDMYFYSGVDWLMFNSQKKKSLPKYLTQILYIK